MARHVQARIATQQVPTVVHVIRLGDFDVTVVAAGRLEEKRRALVLATLDVIDIDRNLLLRHALHDFVGAATQARFLRGVVELRTHTFSRAGQRQLHARVAQHQRVPILETAEAVHRVKHDGELAIGFGLLGQMT